MCALFAIEFESRARVFQLGFDRTSKGREFRADFRLLVVLALELFGVSAHFSETAY